MKTDEQVLEEWVNDEIVFHSCNKNWVMSRHQATEVVSALSNHLDFLFKQMHVNDGEVVRAYDMFPVNTLKEIYELFRLGVKVTAQEFAKCETTPEFRLLLMQKFRELRLTVRC